eukprot:g2049.t1
MKERRGAGEDEGISWRTALMTCGAVVQFGCIVYVIENYVVELTSCVGPSMLPTLNRVGDLVLAEHISYRFLREPAVGDVVLCKSPKDPDQTVCKRIVGMSNDVVRTTKGKRGPTVEVIVPRGHIWIEGDNADNSTDSRYYGPVPQALLCGRVFCKVWPLWEMGRLDEAPPRRKLEPTSRRVRFYQNRPAGSQGAAGWKWEPGRSDARRRSDAAGSPTSGMDRGVSGSTASSGSAPLGPIDKRDGRPAESNKDK